MRVLFCGDRNWTNRLMIIQAMHALTPSVVIEGEARGADRLAAECATELGIPVERYPADWDGRGLSAGYERNARMLVEGKPDFVAAFHSDIANSKGTRQMMALAHRAGVTVALYVDTSKPVHIGRPSIYGNPYVIGRDGSREVVVGKYLDWFHRPEQAAFRRTVALHLRGRELWCPGCRGTHPCHGDVFAEFLEQEAA